MLIGQFWGTGDAAGVPSPFCGCEVCNEARERAGKFQRLRSCFRLSDKIMIDLGADTVCQSMKYGSLCELDYVFVTHTHDDHLSAHAMVGTQWTKTRSTTLNYYLTDKAYDIVDMWCGSDWMVKGATGILIEQKRVAFHKLEYGRQYNVDGITVTPFRGRHKGNVGESSAMYLFELPDGRTLFYGLDSGIYFEETVKELKNHRIDIFISEATCGTYRVENYPYHMDIYNVRDLVDTLLGQGTLSRGSKLYLTHINHRTSHAQMEGAVEKLAFPIETIVAYDGLKIL